MRLIVAFLGIALCLVSHNLVRCTLRISISGKTALMFFSGFNIFLRSVYVGRSSKYVKVVNIKNNGKWEVVSNILHEHYTTKIMELGIMATHGSYPVALREDKVGRGPITTGEKA
ncbi:hypothetical protein PsorP6_014454 [Peronosclerospora sorghi]|uniref:Uncharacterized protein n=1 Tax=Peronosclerospora sorghi TaxID=230839 RepID=A0ACC0VUU8_9STRA|nr:hypothetical protein PsorP6_014454 [Peronosclerospora sorghi]